MSLTSSKVSTEQFACEVTEAAQSSTSKPVSSGSVKEGGGNSVSGVIL